MGSLVLPLNCSSLSANMAEVQRAAAFGVSEGGRRCSPSFSSSEVRYKGAHELL